MIDRENDPGMDRQKIAKDLESYAHTLREASLELEEKVEELSLLRRIGNAAGCIVDPEAFYRTLVDILLEETQAENCSLMLLDHDEGSLVLKIARGRNDDGTYFDDLRDSKTHFPLGHGIAGKAALARETILISDSQRDDRFEARATRFPIGSLLCSPLVFREKMLGVITLSHGQARAFGENTKRVAEILCAFVSPIISDGLARVKLQDEENYKAMFEGVKLSTLLIDPETETIIYCNSHAEEWLGFSRDDYAKQDRALDIVLAEHREKMQELLAVAAKEGKSQFCEISFVTKDGAVRMGETNAATIKYQGRSAVQVTIRDVTERKEMEEKLVRSEKLKALGELAGGVAHDFNNVLSAILGRAQLLRSSLGAGQGTVGEGSIGEVAKGLEIIEKAALDGGDTVRRIQEFSRMRTDDKNFVLVDINELVEHSIEFTKVRWKSEAESKGIAIGIRKELSSLPPVLGSASELREVLTNFINNAVDAMPKGGDIVIKTSAHDSGVGIEVRDTGIGIPGSIQDKIFDPFFTTKGPRSTGLGMSVSYGIITRHHGTISVESEEGRGTAFTITLPESEPVKDRTREGQRLAEGSRKARILVIEDEEAVRMLLNDILAAEGHEVCACSNGKDGMEAFRKQCFDVVFTDLGMPGMSGWEVARSLKSFDPGATMVLVTGWGIQLDERELATAGVDLVMNKPFSVEEIVKLAQEAMDHKETVNRQ